MSFNLLDLVKDQVTGALVEKAAGFIGESTGSTSSALTSIVPSLIGGLVSKAEQPTGITDIMGLLKTDGVSGALGNLGNLFGGDSSSLGLGNTLVTGLLGDKVGGVVSMISKVAGIGEGSSSSLLKMAAPLLLGTLGKKVLGGGGVGLSGLKDLIFSQKDHIKDALPSGFASTLGISSFADMGSKVTSAATSATSAAKNTASAATSAARNTASAATSAATDTAAAAGGGLKKLLPILLLAGAGLLAFLFFKKCKGGEATAVDTTEHVEGHTTEGHVTEGHATHTTEGHVTEGHVTEGHVEHTTEGHATTSHTTTTTSGTVGDHSSSATVGGATGGAGTFSFADAASKWGVSFKDGAISAANGATVTEETINGVNVKTFSKGGILTKIFKNNDGVETVIVKDAAGKLSFFQKAGGFFKKIGAALAFRKTKLKANSLGKGWTGLLDNAAKGAKGKIPGVK